MSDELHYGYGSKLSCGTGSWNKSGFGSGYDLSGGGSIDCSGEGCGWYYSAAGLLNCSGDGSGIGSVEGDGSSSGEGDGDSINVDFLNP